MLLVVRVHPPQWHRTVAVSVSSLGRGAFQLSVVLNRSWSLFAGTEA